MVPFNEAGELEQSFTMKCVNVHATLFEGAGMKKFFLVMVFCLMGGAGWASEDLPSQTRQWGLLFKEADAITNVYGYTHPTPFPYLSEMNDQQRNYATRHNEQLWEDYKARVLRKGSGNEREMDLALDRAYDRYKAALDSQVDRMVAAKNRQREEARDALIVDGLEQNSGKMCVTLPGGVLDCF